MSSSSQSSGPSGPSGPLSLPLCKFSYCTTPTLASKMTWTHIPAQDDMFAVVDQVRRLGLGGAITTRKMLKLLRGGQILVRQLINSAGHFVFAISHAIRDQIDLHDLMFQARLDEERAGSQSIPDSEPRVVLIIKRPLVALRYQLADSQIRRLQLKFKTDPGYDAMVELFESLGFQISDRTPPEPPKCSQISSQPLYAGLSRSISQDRRPSAPVIPVALNTGPLPFPDFIPRATTSCGSETRPASSAPEICSVRPFTAPISLSQMLPPKRVLPFPSKPVKPLTPNSEVTLSSSISDPPELAENLGATDLNNTSAPTTNSATVLPLKALTVNTANSQHSNQPQGVTSTPLDTEMIDVPSTPEVPLKTIHSKSVTTNDAVTKIAKPRRKPPSKPKKVVEPPKDPKSRPGPSKTTCQSFGVFEDVEPAEIMARLDSWVREYQHLPAPRPMEPTSENLTKYAAQSKEERMTIIDDMICECLGDENFVKLVEDVRQSWRRIGMGL
ncbi:hypothetical protein MMC07_002501 [Pseudocyphellaria aurata]|nr:hypothetical protein [Pseudocyphellaria aurata]